MRKKICNYCQKIVQDTHKCQNRFKNRVKTERTKASDKLLNCKRWRDKRQHILARDKICMRCYHKYGIINIQDLQVHHIKSRIQYPELAYSDDNLVVVCKSCNLSLEAKNLEHQIDFEWKIEDRDFSL